jgi:hypothetical protein
MSKTHLIIPDPHAHPDFNNDRATWAGNLIKDVKPDVVVMLGDSADMPSMSGYDKGTRSFHGRSYSKDINAHLDFQEKLWAPVKKAKKRLPLRVALEGNHEFRIKRAIEHQPELDGAVSFDHLQLPEFYDRVVEYAGNTPGVIDIDGVHYAHFFVSGATGS